MKLPKQIKGSSASRGKDLTADELSQLQSIFDQLVMVRDRRFLWGRLEDKNVLRKSTKLIQELLQRYEVKQ
jgi:hypothetical protein